MADDQVNVSCPEIPACPECPKAPDIDIKAGWTYDDWVVYLSGQALNAHIQNKTDFEGGHYPCDIVASYCKKWADAVLNACGFGGSPQGNAGSSGGDSGSGGSSGSSGGSLGCGASASGSGSSCSGSCSASPSGGQPPYSYQWSSGETTKTINNKCAGTYTVTCQDSSGSTATASCTLT